MTATRYGDVVKLQVSLSSGCTPPRLRTTRLYGSRTMPHKRSVSGLPTAERFWGKVDRHGPTPEHAPHLGPCWLWMGYRKSGKSDGYGRFYADGRISLAHRVSYALSIGQIPDGLTLDHLCRNRGCVNPCHLDAVTNRVNCMRGESFSALNARKTHCKHGHEFTEKNTYRMPNGNRACKACRAIVKLRKSV
jgi:hypothetical protein